MYTIRELLERLRCANRSYKFKCTHFVRNSTSYELQINVEVCGKALCIAPHGKWEYYNFDYICGVGTNSVAYSYEKKSNDVAPTNSIIL